MENENGNVSIYLDCSQNEAKRMQTSNTQAAKIHTCSRLGRCRGFGSKVAPKVPLPLIFKN